MRTALRGIRPVSAIVVAVSASLLAPPSAVAAQPPPAVAASPGTDGVPEELVPAEVAEVLGDVDAEELARRLDPERSPVDEPPPAMAGPADEVVLMMEADRSGPAGTSAIERAAGRALTDGTWSARGSIGRGRLAVHTLDMPRNAGIVKVSLRGLAPQSQVRFRLFHPAGYPLDFGFGTCFINYVPPTGPDPSCEGPERYLTAPSAGLWQVVVESRRTTPLADNPYTVEVAQLTVDAPPVTAPIRGRAGRRSSPGSCATRAPNCRPSPGCRPSEPHGSSPYDSPTGRPGRTRSSCPGSTRMIGRAQASTSSPPACPSRAARFGPG